MDRCDVLVVGGGPAGSSCAWKLSQAGLDVIVADKSQFPRDKVCAGWVTPAVWQELDLDRDDYRQGRTLQPITRFATGMMFETPLETAYDHEVSYAIRRCEFDDYLLRRSAASLRLGISFRSLRRDDDAWIFNDSIRARVVVGAGGHFCPIARQFSKQEDSESSPQRKMGVVLAQESELEMTQEQQQRCTVLPDRPELYFYPDLKGYAWVVRKGSFINIGVGREDEPHLSAYAQQFFDWLIQSQKIPRDLAYRPHGHAYRLQASTPEMPLIEGVLLIGDSLGLAVPESGEGIRPAVESGLIAASCILETQNEPAQTLSQLYQARIRARFSRKAFGCSMFSDSPVRRFLARQLMRSRRFTRHVLLDRWFLGSHQPLTAG